MLLVADIGNTNITLGVFQDDTLLETFRIVSDRKKSVEDFCSELEKLKVYKIKKCFIGSVVEELNNIFKQACDKVFDLESMIFNTDYKTGIILDVEKPSTVGADRIANAYGAYKKYKKACIVIDSGSATTFDIISADGRFYGGIIMPGIQMQLNSLCEKTSKLPKIELEDIESVIGRDTKTCILSGVVRGHICAIEGLIKDCEKEIGEEVCLIVTGGLTNLISKYMNRKIDSFEPNLTLEGFKFLYKLNKK